MCLIHEQNQRVQTLSHIQWCKVPEWTTAFETHMMLTEPRMQTGRMDPKQGKRFCELSPCPNNSMGTPIPNVAGFQPLLEELLLLWRAWRLMQGTPVPEHRHVHDAFAGPKIEVLLQEVRNDLQVETRRVGMTFGS